MSEEQVVQADGGEPDIWDESNFVTTSALNGKKGIVVDSEFIRTNYGKPEIPETTVWKIVVKAPGLDKPRALLISVGGELKPSVDLKAPSQAGPYLIGGMIGKGTNVADFITNLKASGFEMGRIRQRAVGDPGAKGVLGAAFMWRAIEKSYTDSKTKQKKSKAYDVPSEFLAFEDIPADLSPAEAASAAAVVTNQERGANDAALRESVAGAVVKALQANSGEITRGQLAIKVGPLLPPGPQRTNQLALLLNDSFIASIPGVTYDKKVVKLLQGTNEPTSEQPAVTEEAQK